jgi:hypothetical protein
MFFTFPYTINDTEHCAKIRFSHDPYSILGFATNFFYRKNSPIKKTAYAGADVKI